MGLRKRSRVAVNACVHCVYVSRAPFACPSATDLDGFCKFRAVSSVQLLGTRTNRSRQVRGWSKPLCYNKLNMVTP
jgi:hypothetical protein